MATETFQERISERPAAPRYNEPPPRQHKSRWWVWVLIILVAGGLYWRFRGGTTNGADQTQSAGRGRGGRGGGAGLAPVSVATAQKADMPVYYTNIGSVNAFNTVTVHTRVDGQLISVAFREGQMVKAGDLLAEVDPRPFQVQLEQAEGQLAKDQAALKDAQVNADRFQQLWKDQVIARQQVDTQIAQAAQFEGSIKSDQGAVDNARLQLSYCRVIAPIGGRVGLRIVDPGNIVHASDANGIAVIAQLQPIAVVFTLPQDQLPIVYSKLRAGQQLSVDAYNRDDTVKIATGTVLTIDNSIDPTTGTYKIKAVFPNADNSLFPNQFVSMHLLVDVKRGMTVVPNAAIQRGPQGTYVYVLQPDNTVKIRTVTTSVNLNGNVGLEAGLVPGDKVVTDGLDKLQDGIKVTVSNGSGGAPQSAAPNAQGGASAQPQAGATQGGQGRGRRGQGGGQAGSSGGH
jgi:multidrug efflux system membrane fusion protein